MSDIELRTYSPDQSDACLAIERNCVQGWPFLIQFERPTFHARAAAYDDWRIAVGMDGDAVVGAVACARKRLIVDGAPASGLFFFDGRVLPAYRNKSLARQLVRYLRAQYEDVDVQYGHAFSSNAATRAGLLGLGWEQVTSLELLALPVARRTWRAVPQQELRDATLDEVCARFLELHGPRSFVVDATGAAGHPGLIACLAGAEASCAIWSNATRFTEAVQGVPARYAAAGWLLDRWPLSLLPTPRLPRVGSPVRGWFVFALAARSARAAANMVRQVEARAREQGIDCLYVVGDRALPWFVALDRARRSWSSARLPIDVFMLWERGTPPAELTYAVDVRDL